MACPEVMGPVCLITEEEVEADIKIWFHCVMSGMTCSTVSSCDKYETSSKEAVLCFCGFGGLWQSTERGGKMGFE